MILEYLKNKFLFFILIFILINFNINSQSINDSIIILSKNNFQNDTIKSDWMLCGFFKDYAKILSSPLKINKKDLRIILPTLSALTITFGFDKEIRNESQKIRTNNAFIDESASLLSDYGSPYSIGAMSFLIFLGGEVSGEKYLARTGFMCMEAIAHTGITVYAIKMLSGRQRPFYENGNDKWHLFPNSLEQFSDESSSKYSSFPSGHAAIAFSAASVIASREKKSKIVPILVYSTASLIALSRIIEDKHYASDVLAGSLIGYGIGKMTVNNNKLNKWTVFPTFFKNNITISASYQL